MVDIELLQTALINSKDGITISDFTKPDNPLVYINPAFEAITGYKSEEILNKNCRYLQGGNRDQPELDVVRNAISNGQSCLVTLRNYRKNGSMFLNELSLSPIVGSDGSVTNYLGVQRDVTSRVLLEESIRREGKGLESDVDVLEYVTEIDPLTALYNRRFLDKKVDTLWGNAALHKESIAVFMMDFDHFTDFNEVYGHQAGNEALQKVAKLLDKSFMKSTDFIARYGGAKFIMLAVGMGDDNVKKYAETIVQKVHDLKVPHEGTKTGSLTVSLGAYITSSSDNQSPQRAIEQADKALYQSKKLGGNLATNLS